MMERKLLNYDTAKIAMDTGTAMTFSGYASTFGNVDSYNDTILPTAYEKTLTNRKNPVLMHYQHDWNVVIGKFIELRSDDYGLFVKGELTPGHSLATDVAASMRHGTLSGLSIGYSLYDNGSKNVNGVRQLSDINLHEISVVVTPADNYARVDQSSVKSALYEAKSLADIEDWLRDSVGFSRQAATTLVSKIKNLSSDLVKKDEFDVKIIEKMFENRLKSLKKD